MPFICLSCGRGYGEAGGYPYACRSCGGVLSFRPEDAGDYMTEVGEAGVWRFRRFIPPLDVRFRISLGEGGTFLHRAERLGRLLGFNELYLKNESTNPSGSFADRGMAVEVSYALSNGYVKLACFSRGNLGVSAAAYAAKTGLECHVYIPPQIERGKLYQLIAYEARIAFKENITRDYVKELINGGYHFITPTSPYFLSGLKTLAYEVMEGFRKDGLDAVVIPVGDGGNISMFWEAVKEFRELGFLNRGDEPRLIAVQSEGCMPVVQAFRRGVNVVKWRKKINTFFQDIASPNPSMGEYALKAIRESKGTAIAVSDEKIIDAAKQLAKTEGILAEPAAASTIAAVKKLKENNMLGHGDRVVCIITGSGLKEPVITHPTAKFQHTIATSSRIFDRIGKTKSLILKILYENPMHGYGIMKLLRERYGVVISMPSIYQHLTELTEAGLVEVKPAVTWRKRKKIIYELTIAGRKTAQQISKP